MACMALFIAQAANAHILEEVWDKYSALSHVYEKTAPEKTPGEIIGKAQGANEHGFDWPWKYRSTVYEMHYEIPEQLARGIYSLALYAKDIDANIPREKFYKGVLGFHYTAAQIASWLNDCVAKRSVLTSEENIFAGKMLVNGIIGIGRNGFEPSGKITHVLGASGGKKRSFAQNLLHERLHVFWDEDHDFQTAAYEEWKNLSGEEKEKILQSLKNYNPHNENQLVEEWTISKAEKNKMPIR